MRVFLSRYSYYVCNTNIHNTIEWNMNRYFIEETINIYINR